MEGQSVALAGLMLFAFDTLMNFVFIAVMLRHLAKESKLSRRETGKRISSRLTAILQPRLNGDAQEVLNDAHIAVMEEIVRKRVT